MLKIQNIDCSALGFYGFKASAVQKRKLHEFVSSWFAARQRPVNFGAFCRDGRHDTFKRKSACDKETKRYGFEVVQSMEFVHLPPGKVGFLTASPIQFAYSEASFSSVALQVRSQIRD